MSQEPSETLLFPYRVLDLTDEKGFLCGKILGDMGADVVKIEPPGGDPSRRIGPFYKDIPDPEKSLYWFAYNTSKRGITLNIETADGRELFKRLVGRADLVIESSPPGTMEGLGLGYAVLRELNPGLILTSITPYGQDGPYRDYKGADIVCWALGGMAFLCGDPDRAPLQVSFPQSYLHAAAEAAAASNLALYHRKNTGEGQHIDVSAQACVPWCTMNALEFWPLNRSIITRAGPYRHRPAVNARDRQIWPCKDGYVHFLMMGGIVADYMTRLVAWMDEEGAADEYIKEIKWAEFDMAYLPQSVYDALEEPIGKFFMRYTMKELYEEAVRRRVQLYPVCNAREIVESPQLEARNFWQEVEHPELKTTITYPGAFLKVTGAKCGISRRAPLIGEHNEEIFCGELGLKREELVLLRQAGVI